jgi:hypothetical protein
MTTVINNFTVSNANLGKFSFTWTLSGPIPQKININVYSDSGYATLLYIFSTEPTFQ